MVKLDKSRTCQWVGTKHGTLVSYHLKTFVSYKRYETFVSRYKSFLGVIFVSFHIVTFFFPYETLRIQNYTKEYQRTPKNKQFWENFVEKTYVSRNKCIFNNKMQNFCIRYKTFVLDTKLGILYSFVLFRKRKSIFCFVLYRIMM